jgi:hypothetical protein
MLSIIFFFCVFVIYIIIIILNTNIYIYIYTFIKQFTIFELGEISISLNNRNCTVFWYELKIF